MRAADDGESAHRYKRVSAGIRGVERFANPMRCTESSFETVAPPLHTPFSAADDEVTAATVYTAGGVPARTVNTTVAFADRKCRGIRAPGVPLLAVRTNAYCPARNVADDSWSRGVADGTNAG